jgi:hypothetical protein
MKLLLAAGSGAAALAGPTAQADIVYSGPIGVTAQSVVDGVYIQMSNFATGYGLETPTAWTFNPYHHSGDVLGIHYAGDGVVLNSLSAGTPVQTQTFQAAGGEFSIYSISGFSSTPSYLGVEFNDGGGEMYGWVEISYDGSGFVTIDDAAYNSTPGGAINAGQTTVPEPAVSAWVGAMLAGSVAAWAARKRRKEKKAA